MSVLLALLAYDALSQGEYQTVQFTPYEAATVYAQPDRSSGALRVIPARQSVTVYTPYVGAVITSDVPLDGDGLLWGALNPERTEWVAVAVHGVCPRERLGDIE